MKRKNPFLLKIFLLGCGPFLTFFTEFVTILLLFYALLFVYEACGILAPH